MNFCLIHEYIEQTASTRVKYPIMSERIEIKPFGANPRQLDHIIGVLVRGGLIAYPTDSGYALGWRSNNRKARDRVIRLRGLDRHHHFTYCCRSLSDIGKLAKLQNSGHRLIRQLTPGPYTFVLESTNNVSRNAQMDNVVPSVYVSPTIRWYRVC